MKNGIKIMNVEGAEILKNNIEGKNINKDYKGVFANSLLSEKLKELGLNITKNDTTRDIIMLSFSHGYTKVEAYEKMDKISKLKKEIKAIRKDIKALEEDKKAITGTGSRILKEPYNTKIKQEKDKILGIKEEIELFKVDVDINSYNREDVRDYLYKNGFSLDFGKLDKKTNTYKITDTIEYVYWFRSSSKARVGDVLFINKKLYEKINRWQTMDLDTKSITKIVELESYKALTSSAIEYTITLSPAEILVIEDIEEWSNEIDVAEVNVDEDGKTYVEHKKDKVKNILFDGQALGDISLFKGSEGMMLLRQHFFKACAFKTNIQLFFEDYCKVNNIDYDTFTVKDRYNNDVLAKNIKLITTENAMKWEKFGVDFVYWCDKVREDNNVFGVCKTDHASKYGELQRSSYQMINSLMLNENEAIELCKDTVEYMNKMKLDGYKYAEFLKITKSDINANEMICDLVKHNKKFVNSKFFRDYRKREVSEYINEYIRAGKLFLEGDNLTVVSNPYAMLEHSVGQYKGIDVTLPLREDSISCYTKRFDSDELLCAFRNPHNSANNIICLHNTESDLLDRYFDFSNIIAVNSIKTDIQDRANSMDFDSDFIFTTNNCVAVEKAKEYYNTLPCIVNNIKTSTKTYENNISSNVIIDNTLAKAKTSIGESSNIAQVALSLYSKDKVDVLNDVVIIMSVLAQVAIDNAKRVYEVDVNKEIKRLRKVVKTYNDKLPNFFRYLKDLTEDELEQKISDKKICTMDYIQAAIDNIVDADRNGNEDNHKLKNGYFIKKLEAREDNKQLDKILDKVIDYDNYAKSVVIESQEMDDKDYEAINNKLDEVVNCIKKLKVNEHTMNRLVRKALVEKNLATKVRRRLLNVLYKSHRDVFMSVFYQN